MNDRLETLSESGAAPRSRIKDAASALQIWNTIRKADVVSSFDRARIDAAYDNERPFSDAKVQAYRVNVSWGWLDMVLGMAMAGYVDIYNAVESFFKCPTTYGISSERDELEQVVAKEVSDTIRSWPGMFWQYLRLCTTFVKHGVSIALMEDESNWQWAATDLSDFKIPRKTKVGQENLKLSCCLRFYSPTDLYKMIEDPKIAKDLGYNVECIRQAIRENVNKNQSFSHYKDLDWEKLEIELRNNDLFFSHGGADTESIRVINFWVQEFNGKVSHYMVLDDNDCEDFLYKGIDRFDNTYQAFVFFVYGAGTNGYYHGVRGQGYKAFPSHGALNIAACQMLEMATYGSAITLQPNDESAMQEMQFLPTGPFNIITPGIKVLKDAVAPNVSQNQLPVLQTFSQMFRDRTSQYNTEPLVNNNIEKSRFQLQAELGAIAKMSVSDLNLFYTSMELLLKEVVKRMARPSYAADEPGGEYIEGLRERLLQRGQESGGTPDRYLQAFYSLDHDRLTVKKAIGNGSEAARMLAFDRMMTLFGSLPDWGKEALVWDMASETVGYRNAARYANRPGQGETQTFDTGMAQVENNLLRMGGEVMRIDGQNDFTHAKTHMAFEQPLLQQTEDAIVSDDIETAAQLLPVIAALTKHTWEHVEKLSADPLYKEESAEFRKMLEQSDEVIHNGTLKVEKRMAEAQKEQQYQEGQQQPQIDPAVLAKIEGERIKRESEMAMAAQKHELEMNIKREEAYQKLVLRDAETANKITNQAGVRATSK
jgi:hypothetical protein